MANLATYEDVEARLGITFTEPQRERVTLLLQDASIAIRRYTKQDFEYVEDDSIILRPVGTWLRLPQKPVENVTGVFAQSGYAGLPEFALVAWVFDQIDKINIYGGTEQVVNYPEWWYQYEGANTYRVVYSHGYAEIPDDVVATAANMVIRIMTSPTNVGGMVSERIGQYFYQMQQSQGTAGAAVRLNSDDKAAIDPYRKKATTIELVT
jgi:hypothetical protein